jgi:hypothetical protein
MMARAGLRLVVFALFFGCAANATLNNFYVTGASVWDAGWFAWLASHAVVWPIPNPPVIGGAFLAIHAAPVFFLLTALKDLLPPMPDPVWFALTQGVWFGLLGLAVSLCLAANGRGATLAVIVAANGITLATLGFPHFEIAVPALLLLSLALRRHTALLWGPPLLLMLGIREDAGFHAALAYAALALLRAHGERRLAAGAADGAIALVCLLAGGAALAIQHAVPGGGGALAGTYLGRPALAHVDAGFLAERMHYLVKDRATVWAPLLLLGLTAAWYRDLRLAAGVAISLPWLALSFVAVSHQAGEMWDYYSFPLMAGLCWPLLCAARLDAVPRSRFVALQAAMAVLSLGLFAGSGGNHDRRPWSHFGFDGWSKVAPIESALDRITADPKGLDHLAVDDSVAALRLGSFTATQLHPDFAFSIAEQDAITVLIYRPGTWRDDRKRKLIARAGLADPQPLAGGFFIRLQRPGAPAPP